MLFASLFADTSMSLYVPLATLYLNSCASIVPDVAFSSLLVYVPAPTFVQLAGVSMALTTFPSNLVVAVTVMVVVAFVSSILLSPLASVVTEYLDCASSLRIYLLWTMDQSIATICSSVSPSYSVSNLILSSVPSPSQAYTFLVAGDVSESTSIST